MAASRLPARISIRGAAAVSDDAPNRRRISQDEVRCPIPADIKYSFLITADREVPDVRNPQPAGSKSQNVEPTPISETSPTLPRIRSIPFFTTAKPIPVPG